MYLDRPFLELALRVGVGGGEGKGPGGARRLEALPVITAKFATGELSYSKVRALTRVASPDDEEQFVGLATAMTAEQLERLFGLPARRRQQRRRRVGGCQRDPPAPAVQLASGR